MRATDEAAVREFPELVGLIILREAGWRFLPPRPLGGTLTDLHGFRAWPGGWTDAIRVRSPTDVMALRSDGREPPGVVWERTGTLGHVIGELLALPAPNEPSAPRLVRSPAPILWTPSRTR
ncbi:hypothetical protein FB471_4062 [Amycolatopsis cihanbeyliensis]|uniref:Uncharacterized protein n=1 Tax=Amycolatopsis cihanbeyliensis TaxID=1128664 RepID=A0A542DMG2_AMYCI|nr:hypothetical protein FB471_4062 [Amycolatopsis cihanbeyliensis]